MIRLVVLRAHTQRLLHDLVLRIVEAERDIVLVGVTDRLETLAGWCADADVALVPDDVGGPAEIETLLEAAPGLRVIAFAPRDGSAQLHELRPHRVTLGDLSPAELLRAIRAPRGVEWVGRPARGVTG